MTNGGMPKKTLAALALGAVAVRLGYLAAFARHYRPRSDASHYQALAEAFADGDGISSFFPFTYTHPTAFRPPLYPAVLGAFYWVTGVHVGAGQLLNVALGATVVVLAALLGAHIAGYRGGVAAGVAVAVYPPLLANDVVLLSEPLSLALLLGMILLLVHDRPAWAGLACGLLVLTRPSAQLLVVVVVAWLVWRVGWRSAVRLAVVTIVVVAPWLVRNWVLIGAPVVVTSNGFNLVSTYSAEAQASGGFANAIFDDRFDPINFDNRSELDLDDAYRDHAIDAVREHRTIPLRVLGHNLANYFEFRPDKNENAEEDDGRNLNFRNVTLPLFYVVTAAGLVGLWRFRRRRGAELLLVQAAYFTLACLATISVPRLRAPLDLAAAIGASLLVAALIGEQERSESAAEPATAPEAAPRWAGRTRVLVALAVVAGVVAAAGGAAFARARVENDAQSQLERKIARAEPAVQRLAAADADGLVGGTAVTTKADFKQAETLAEGLWLLSPRISGALRSEARDAARALDEAIFELRVLDLVTGANRNPGTERTVALDASRATYEEQARPSNDRLPDWDTISANPAMRRAAQDLDRLEDDLSS